MTVLEIIGVIVLFLIIIVSIPIIIFGLPGCWIILAAALIFGIFTEFVEITLTVVLILFVMAAVAEGIEFLAVMYGAKKYGASRRGMVGAIIGAILGAILFSPFLLVIGAVIGAFVGAFLGAFLVEYIYERDVQKAGSAGFGAFLGKLGGTIAKVAMAVAMAAVVVGAVF